MAKMKLIGGGTKKVYLDGFRDGLILAVGPIYDENGNVIEAANPLPINIAAVGAGTIAVNVVGASSMATATPILLGGGAYASGDALGGIMEFTQVSRVAGFGVVLTNLIITDLTVQAPRPTIELWLFDRPFTATPDNDPWGPADPQLPSCYCIHC